MDGGTGGERRRADAGLGPGGAGMAGPPTAWPDGTPAGAPPPSTWGPWAPPGPPPTQPLWGAWPPAVPPAPPEPPRRRGRGALAVLAVVGMVCAVAVAVVVADPLGDRSNEPAASWRSDADPEDLGPPEDPPADRPTVGPPERATTVPPPPTTPPTRLAPPPTAPAEGGTHAFLAFEDDGDPVTWDPCETIQYVVNDRTAPPGAVELLAEAVAATTAATGLVFEDMGPTDEAPTPELSPRTDPGDDEGPPPVLIAWTDPEEIPMLVDAAGVASPDWVHEGAGEHEYVSGTIVLDGPFAAELVAQGDRTTVVHLLLHELGHLVGLDHVEDTSQVMYHNRDGRGEIRATWNTGDLTGLAALGNGPCNPDA